MQVMNSGKRKRTRKWRRTLKRLASSDLGIGLSVALILPFILVFAPFVLTANALAERRRVCPNCGRRGTLQPQVFGSGNDYGPDGFSAIRRRVNPKLTVLKCSVCGAEFRRGELPG